MLSAQVTDWSLPPKPVQVIPPPLPVDESKVQIRVLATGLHQLVRSRASGKHYTSGSLPHTPGVDGVGVDVSSGKDVYFSTLAGGTGSFAEIVNIPTGDITEIPAGVEPVVAAAFMNPVMSSWMGLRKRVDFLKNRTGKEGRPWKVFILGVTSASGKLAIKIARSLGATSVIGAARNASALSQLPLDASITLQTPSETDFSAAADADVVLDYLYGPWVEAYLASATTASATNPLTWVSIGAMAGGEAAVPAGGLRRRDVTLRGSGPGAWEVKDLADEAEGMLRVLEGERLEGVREVRMEDVEEGWTAKGKERVVLVFGK